MTGKIILTFVVAALSMELAMCAVVCNCPKILAPVCSTTGVTYNSECLLNCAGEVLASTGACSAVVKREAVEETTTLTPCTNEYAPECGTDGVMYSNPCLRERANVLKGISGECNDADSGLKLVKREAVEETMTPTPCTNEYAPECGTDGVMYSNPCLRERANVLKGECNEADSGLKLG